MKKNLNQETGTKIAIEEILENQKIKGKNYPL